MIRKQSKSLITESFSLKFNLESDILGTSEISFDIEVEIEQEEGKELSFTFGGKFDKDKLFAEAQGEDF